MTRVVRRTAPARRALAAALSLAVALSFARSAGAQAFSRLEPGQQTVTAETGLQMGMVTTLGYAAGLRVAALDRTVMPFAAGTMVVGRPDLSDYAVRAGAQTSLVKLGWFDLSAQLAFEVAGTENSIHTATALRTDVVLLAGHYGRAWFLVAEAGYAHAWLTHIESSAWYRTYIYPEARDGWYGNGGGMLHGGAKGGVRMGPVEVIARAGLNATERLNVVGPPFYATLGGSYRF